MVLAKIIQVQFLIVQKPRRGSGNIQQVIRSIIINSVIINLTHLSSIWNVLRTTLGSSINYKKAKSLVLCGAYILVGGEKNNKNITSKLSGRLGSDKCCGE